MGTSVSVPEFVGKIKGAAVAIEKNRKEQLKVIGEEMEKIHTGVIESALHGPKFRRWNVPIVAKAKPTTEGLIFAPQGRSHGPEKVAEQGRHRGNAGGFAGPGVNKKTGATARNKSGGVRNVKAVKGKRWNGTTEGKKTWTKTTAEFSRTLPPKLQSSFVRAVSEVFH